VSNQKFGGQARGRSPARWPRRGADGGRADLHLPRAHRWAVSTGRRYGAAHHRQPNSRLFGARRGQRPLLIRVRYSGAPPPLARDHPFGSDALRATRPTVADRADQRRRRIASAFATDARRSRRGRGGSVLSELGLAPIFRSQNRVGFSMDSVARGIDPSTAQWWSTCQWPRCAASDRS